MSSPTSQTINKDVTTLALATNRYFFGKGAVEQLSKVLAADKIKRVMLVYGGGSIKASGLRQTVVKQIKGTKASLVEFPGVQPNPLTSHINEGARVFKNEKCQALVAVGGGSVIDAAKMISAVAAFKQPVDCWQIATGKKQVSEAECLPVYAINTTLGTGSENNGNSAVRNEATQEKTTARSLRAPTAAFMDPALTFTVPSKVMAAGVFDALSHLMEAYLVKAKGDDFHWTSEYLLAQIRVVMRFGRTAVKEPTDYAAKANLMWTSAFALNRLAWFNNKSRDWSVHFYEHGLSAVYDVAHGDGLALLTPTYLQMRIKDDPFFKQRVALLGRAVCGKQDASLCIRTLVAFIKDLNLPSRWSELPGMPARPTKKELDCLVAKVRDGNRQVAARLYALIPV